ncbi:MAG: methyltetrahydrofolate cobalamin methyltransferase, partial [Paracoccus sp. (in: a-proteobacteria)]
GLPHRHGVNAAFLPMAIGAGMTSAIMNPVRMVEMEAIRAANMLMNHDPNGGEWIRFARVIEAVGAGATYAEASKAAAGTGTSGSRRGGRRARG